MQYKLYTTVDITNTGQYRNEPNKENARWKEQNFQTILQTISMRSNISYYSKPTTIDVKGVVVGIPTEEIVRVWRFDFETERDNAFDVDKDPVGLLKKDFNLVPYINNLDEDLTQNYSVFVTEDDSRNIVFYKKQ